jgi:hypothetical protein
MLLSVAGDLLLFSVTVLGLGVFFATWFHGFSPLDRLSLGLGAAMILLYLAGFARYLLALPPAALWLLVILALVLVALRHKMVRTLAQHEEIRRALGYWVVLAVWCLGWQMLIVSYSGGSWSGDWQEHYDRAHFFLQRWPTDHLFIGLYPLPARPPLANLVISGFLGLSGGAFSHFQVFSTLLATLVFLPLASLVQKLQPGGRAPVILLGLLMLSPLFVQNATFPWTKLPAAFFIVLAVGLLSHPTPAVAARSLTCALVALAAALLTHYSAAPWLIAGGGAWLAAYHGQLHLPANRRGIALGVLLGSLLFLTWLGWSWSTYGTKITFTANTTSSLAFALPLGDQIHATFGNIYRTLVPAWLWEGMPALLQQESLMARLRDRWFCLYQLNLPLAFGLGGVVVLGRLILPRARPGDSQARFWWVLVILIIGLSSAVHPSDPLGLTHISLQPLVLLGLAWLAARGPLLPAGWVRLWTFGLGVDFIFGVALHFGVQSLWLDRWLNPGLTELEYFRRFSQPAAANYFGRLRIGAEHLATGIPPAVALLLLVIGALFTLVSLRSSAGTRQR